jgi:mitotic spindle assembly checkpoint protein MAD2
MVYVLPRFIPSANTTHDDQPLQTPRPPPEKPEKEIQSEIQAIIRQITASVTFLPLLEDPCEAAV